jgi:DNA-binding response OmpR family regulator
MMTAPTILIVDDNVNLARGFAMVLRGVGYTAHTAHTAEDGLSLALAHRPDAIILDFDMPFVNGVGLLYRLRALPSIAHTPVVIVTGASVTDEMRTDLADLGATLRLKPLGVTALLAEVEQVLADRRDPLPPPAAAPSPNRVN